MRPKHDWAPLRAALPITFDLMDSRTTTPNLTRLLPFAPAAASSVALRPLAAWAMAIGGAGILFTLWLLAATDLIAAAAANLKEAPVVAGAFIVLPSAALVLSALLVFYG